MMLGTPFKRLLAMTLVVMASGFPSAVQSQARGGPPGGFPVGPPAGLPSPRGGFPGLAGGRGPPPWAEEEAANGATGIARASEVSSGKLSDAQRDRAAGLAKASPELYELDRNGALAIRGEVLAMGLDANELAGLERRGFVVRRPEVIPGTDLLLAVVSRDGTDAAHAVRMLRRVAPNGTYAFNHVLFESGIHSPRGSAAPAMREQAREGATTIGLIDSGVAPIVEANPRIRLMRHYFAQGESRPTQHGTAVASLLAREPGRVTIYAADIFGSDPRGGTSELLVRALGWMASERVPVVNVSMVGPANAIVATVIAKLLEKGFIIVAPVGNDGGAAKLLYPASYPGVVAVSGVTQSGRLLPEASRVKRVDFVAPGIASVPDVSGHPVEVRGTSFAAPIVSRLIADHLHSLDPAAAREAIETLAARAGHAEQKADRPWFGRGLVGMDTHSP